MAKQQLHEEMKQKRNARVRAEKKYMVTNAMKYGGIALIGTIGCIYEAMAMNQWFVLIPVVVTLTTAIVFSRQSQVVFKTNLDIAKEAMEAAPHIYQDIKTWHQILPRQAQISFNWLVLGFLTLMLPILLAFKQLTLITFICCTLIVYVIYVSLGFYFKVQQNANLILKLLHSK